MLANSGAGYFIKGFELIRMKGIRRFVLIPLSINLVLFSIAFYFMFIQLQSYMVIIEAWLPDWMTWLSIVLWPIAVLFILVMFSFIFSSIMNWIAAPFNGLLSEKMEALLTNEKPPSGDAFDIIKGGVHLPASYVVPLVQPWLLPCPVAELMAAGWSGIAFRINNLSLTVARNA